MKKQKNINTGKKAGFFFIFLSLFYIWHGKDYPLGSLSKMDYGFFPLIISYLLLFFSFLLILFEKKNNDR